MTIFKKRPHRHRIFWDGWYEHCSSCGACAGDVRDANGYRCITFDQWPENKYSN